MFQHLDINKDDKISKEELLQHFAKLDADSDGNVTREEIAKQIASLHVQHGHAHHAPPADGMKPGTETAPRGTGPGRSPHESGLGGSRGDGRGGFWRPSATDVFNRLDRNQDGKITKDEVPPPIWQRLSEADTDNDGSISKAELEEHFKKRPLPGRPHGGPPPGTRTPNDKPREEKGKAAAAPAEADSPATASSAEPDSIR